MASILLQRLNVITFGAMSLIIIHQIVLVPLTMQPDLHSPLVTTIIVIQVILLPMIHCGMGSSVKVPAAMVPTLPHGSVYSFLLQQLI